MSLKIACPNCDAKLLWKQEKAPGEVTCPKCRQKFRPQAEPVDEGAGEDEYAVRETDRVAAPEPVAAFVKPGGAGEKSAEREKVGQGQRERAVPKEEKRTGRKGVEGQEAEGKRAGGEKPERPREPGAAGAKAAWAPGGSSADLMKAVVQAFQGQTVHRPPTLIYRLALLFSAGALCLLIVAYIACLIGFGYALYLYAVHFVPNSFQVRGRAVILVVLMHIGVAVAGLGILYSMIVPLFRWGGGKSDALLLDSGAHPVLHCFVRALCDLIGSPQPDEIRLDATPNAFAGRYGGFLGIIGGRFVLIIGEPLFYGCELRALAGIIAHELGHFSQATGSWLMRYIATVTDWFQEATFRTKGLQESIRDQEVEGNAQAIVWVAYLTTGLGSLILMQFALLSRIIAFNLMRQQEFDADRYEAEVAGSGQFARTFERLCELQVGFENVVLTIMSGGTLHDTGLGFGGQVVYQADELSDRDRRRVSKLMSPQKSKWFDSHPSPTERIAAVSRRPQPGIFQLEGPAICLLNVKAVMRSRGESE